MYFIIDGKAEFLASLLQSLVSHDPSEIILTFCFGAQEIFLINVENNCAAYINFCCGNGDFQYLLMRR